MSSLYTKKFIQKFKDGEVWNQMSIVAYPSTFLGDRISCEGSGFPDDKIFTSTSASAANSNYNYDGKGCFCMLNPIRKQM